MNWTPAIAPFQCPVVNRAVTVAISTLDIYGQAQFPIVKAQRMDGCSGNETCKIFPSPNTFHARGPFGCPCHTALSQPSKMRA
jgi:hypothetical protein